MTIPFKSSSPLIWYLKTANTSLDPGWFRIIVLPGWQDVVEVNVLNERGDFSTFLNLLASHNLGNLSRILGDTGDEGMAEFSLLM